MPAEQWQHNPLVTRQMVAEEFFLPASLCHLPKQQKLSQQKHSLQCWDWAAAIYFLPGNETAPSQRKSGRWFYIPCMKQGEYGATVPWQSRHSLGSQGQHGLGGYPGQGHVVGLGVSVQVAATSRDTSIAREWGAQVGPLGHPGRCSKGPDPSFGRAWPPPTLAEGQAASGPNSPWAVGRGQVLTPHSGSLKICVKK